MKTKKVEQDTLSEHAETLECIIFYKAYRLGIRQLLDERIELVVHPDRGRCGHHHLWRRHDAGVCLPCRARCDGTK
jgi:hypothetical protein